MRGGGAGPGARRTMLEACGCVRRRDSARSSGGAAPAPGGGGVAAALAPIFRFWRRERGFSMSKTERTMKAALLIQRWYRRYLARAEMRRRYTWTIFQSIEYAAEQDQAKLYDFFHALLERAEQQDRSRQRSDRTSITSSISDPERLVSDKSDSDSELGGGGGGGGRAGAAEPGPDLRFPLQRRDLDTLIEAFRKKKHGVTARQAARILKDGAAALRRLHNFNSCSTALSGQVTVCGDLHGQLDDLLVILHKNGLPSLENPYVFNGDFVDRGRWGLETLLLLLASALVFPGAVLLNRGNHEDLTMNARYGFIKEVHQKYKRSAERLLQLVEEVYRALPLGTLINGRVLVVHGGIAADTELRVLLRLDRSKYASVLRPPVPASPPPPADQGGGASPQPADAAPAPAPLASATAQAELVDKAEWKQVFDILWSDPQSAEGCVANQLRGAGTCWGPDVTQSFLQKHGLLAIVRSHECRPDGYEVLHDGKVVTIFSASNYYEVGSNKGAYLKLRGRSAEQLERQFVQFTAGASRARRLTFRQRVGLAESSALRELQHHIAAVRPKLEAAFRVLDTEQCGFISVADWCWALEQTTRLGLPWRTLRDKLVRVHEDAARVRYMDTFETASRKNGRKSSGATTVLEALYKNRSSLEAIFKILDKDNSGYITTEELSSAWALLGEHVAGAGAGAAGDMCRLLDINKDGLVDLNEFLESFRLAERASAPAAPGSPALRVVSLDT